MRLARMVVQHCSSLLVENFEETCQRQSLANCQQRWFASFSTGVKVVYEAMKFFFQLEIFRRILSKLACFIKELYFISKIHTTLQFFISRKVLLLSKIHNRNNTIFRFNTIFMLIGSSYEYDKPLCLAISLTLCIVVGNYIKSLACQITRVEVLKDKSMIYYEFDIMIHMVHCNNMHSTFTATLLTPIVSFQFSQKICTCPDPLPLINRVLGLQK